MPSVEGQIMRIWESDDDAISRLAKEDGILPKNFWTKSHATFNQILYS